MSVHGMQTVERAVAFGVSDVLAEPATYTDPAADAVAEACEVTLTPVLDDAHPAGIRVNARRWRCTAETSQFAGPLPRKGGMLVARSRTFSVQQAKRISDCEFELLLWQEAGSA